MGDIQNDDDDDDLRERDQSLLLPYLQRRHPVVRAELKLVPRGFAQVSH